MADDKEILTIKEAADLLGLTAQTIRKYIADGRLASTQPASNGKFARGGAPHRVRRADVIALATPKLAAYEAPKVAP